MAVTRKASTGADETLLGAQSKVCQSESLRVLQGCAGHRACRGDLLKISACSAGSAVDRMVHTRRSSRAWLAWGTHGNAWAKEAYSRSCAGCLATLAIPYFLRAAARRPP